MDNTNVTPKIVDGKIKFKYRTFDGSYVNDYMYIEDAEALLAKAKYDPDIPGYELVNGNYRFETEMIVLKLKKSSKKNISEE